VASPVVTAGDTMAFLESEPAEGCDLDGNGLGFDSILRVFRRGPVEISPPGINDKDPMHPLPGRDVDAAPKLNGQSIVSSNGLVFFRTPEGAVSPLVTVRASVPDPASMDTQTNGVSTQPALSGDGLSVAFASDAMDIVPNDTNGKRDVFV